MSTIEEVKEQIQSMDRKTVEMDFLPIKAMISTYNFNDLHNFYANCLDDLNTWKSILENANYEYTGKFGFKLEMSYDGYIESLWLVVERLETDEEWGERMIAEVQAEERKQEQRKKEIEAAEQLLQSQGYLIQKNFYEIDRLSGLTVYKGNNIQ